MTTPDIDDLVEKKATQAPNWGPKLDIVYNFEPIVFQVENTLFRVPKHGFNVAGTIFEAMFSLPTADNANTEGTTVGNPIVLQGIDEKYFRSFLNVLYPLFSSPDLGYEDWIGVLHLASMWNFSKVREKAITVLANFSGPMKAGEKIKLGRQFRVHEWVRSGLIDICRSNAITLEDLPQHPYNLDWETIARIFYVREKADRQSERTHTCSCEGGAAVFTNYGPTRPHRICLCRCAAKVDEIFQAEMATL